MANDSEQTGSVQNDAAQLEAEVRRVVEEGLNVQEQVRQLVLRTMGAGQLDLSSFRQMTQAVINGALAGVQKTLQPSVEQAEAIRSKLQQAVAGLDGGLAQFAEATKLALQEATGKAQAFSHGDLSRAKADLQDLEALLIDTLQRSATSATDLAGKILGDLAEHARDSGSAVGSTMHDTLGVISHQLTEAGRSQVQTGLQLAQATTNLLLQITTGVLTGLADRARSDAHTDKET